MTELESDRIERKAKASRMEKYPDGKVSGWEGVRMAGALSGNQAGAPGGRRSVRRMSERSEFRLTSALAAWPCRQISAAPLGLLVLLGLPKEQQNQYLDSNA